jgi:hypothetical protein
VTFAAPIRAKFILVGIAATFAAPIGGKFIVGEGGGRGGSDICCPYRR